MDTNGTVLDAPPVDAADAAGVAAAPDTNGEAEAKDEKRAKGDKRGQTDRTADTLFRILYQHHEQLSSMADTKAHIMITLCAALAGVAATQVFDPLLQYAAATVIVTCLLAAGLAVFATAPSLPVSRSATPHDPRFNPLVFSHFHRLSQEAFGREIERLLGDRQLVYRALTNDLYGLGRVLGRKKFRYLGYCYWTFAVGCTASFVVLAVTVAQTAGGRP